MSLAPVIGAEAAEDLSDAELVDSFYYTLFPNFHPWGAYNRIVYRFRPNGDNHEESIMECMFLSPYSGERPPAAPIHWLGADDSWTDAPELGFLARVFNQDTFNLPSVQRGLNAAREARGHAVAVPGDEDPSLPPDAGATARSVARTGLRAGGPSRSTIAHLKNSTAMTVQTIGMLPIFMIAPASCWSESAPKSWMRGASS